MTIKEFTDVFDRKSPFFFMVIDSAQKWNTDAFVFEELHTKRVSSMIIDRIAYFKEPEFLIQWSDCKEDYRCEKECSDVMVIFAHDEGREAAVTQLKMETEEDVHEYCRYLNDQHHHGA